MTKRLNLLLKVLPCCLLSIGLITASGCASDAAVADVPNEPSSLWYDAAFTGNPSDIQAAVDANANPNVRGAKGRTPLIEAIWAGKVETVAGLLDFGADPNLSDTKSETPLQYAARANEDRVEIAQILLEAGADPDARDSRYSPPLVTASTGGRVEIVKVLLAYGADLYATDKRGRTALDVARAKARGDVITVLKDAEDAQRPPFDPPADGNGGMFGGGDGSDPERIE